jgi:L-fuconolactonase
MNRRQVLGLGALAPLALKAAPAIPVIDTHIHLFDPARPQGVPWPEKTNAALYKPALPARYRGIAVPLGVRGAVVIEASPWLEDNQWVLDTAARDPIIVGTIGNLEPGKPEFALQLERFARNPLYRGIRYGNLWGRGLSNPLGKPEFIADLKRLAAGGMTLDTANPNPELIGAVLRLSDRVPELRIVIDHLPSLVAPADAARAREYRANLAELGNRKRIYTKLSAVFRNIDGQVPRDVSVYRATLDELCGVFGEDRVLYGSDWPNSDRLRPYEDVIGVVREYFAARSAAVQEKYFWKNSVAAYRWVKRDPLQPNPDGAATARERVVQAAPHSLA